MRRVGSPASIASPELAPGETPYVPLRRTNGGRLLLEKAPLFLVVLLSCAVTYLAQKAAGTVWKRLTVPFRLENAAHSYVVYLKKFVFPTHLACFYPIVDLRAGRVALSVATLVVVTLIAWRLRRTQPYLLVGWLWYLGALAPMIGLVQVGSQAYADRYTYFPSLGLGLIGALGLADATRRARLPRPAVIVGASAILTVLGVATWRQTFVWRNSVGLLEHALDATGHNWFARMYLAAEVANNYEFERAEAMLKQSLSEGAPRAKIHAFMSVIYDREHREEDALLEIDAALAADPDDWKILVNRGLYLFKLQRNADAVAALQRAIALDSGDDFKQLDLARRLLATAQRRLGGAEGPRAVPAPR